jgi:hypothetical protein
MTMTHPNITQAQPLGHGHDFNRRFCRLEGSWPNST